jgi:hypothetical protein
MQKRELARLESRINELSERLTDLADDDQFANLIKIIHRPGWTTIAEQALVLGVVDSMIAQAKTLTALKNVLLSGASKVELNPQPLPP